MIKNIYFQDKLDILKQILNFIISLVVKVKKLHLKIKKIKILKNNFILILLIHIKIIKIIN